MNNTDIIGMLHRVIGFMRRGSHGGCQMPPHPTEPDAAQAARTFRERGRILIQLERQDGITQKQLAEMIDIRPQSLSELLYKLEQDGLIERRACELDKRASLVFLSPIGRARIDAIREERRRFADEFLSPLSEEEKDQLAALLGKLIDAHKDAERKEG